MLKLSLSKYFEAVGGHCLLSESKGLTVVNVLRQVIPSSKTCPSQLKRVETEALSSHRKWNWYDPHASGIRSYTDTLHPPFPFYNLKTTRCLYLAILSGHMPLHSVHCRASICKERSATLYRLAPKIHLGYPCYSVFVPFLHAKLNEQAVTYCEILDITGIPFQCRLHALALGYPVVGDNTFSFPEYDKAIVPNRVPSNHLLMHCWKAQYVHSMDGILEYTNVTAPDDLSHLLQLSPKDEDSSKLLNFGANQSQFREDSIANKSIIKHLGFFHTVDSTNFEDHFSALISNSTHPESAGEFQHSFKVEDESISISENKTFFANSFEMASGDLKDTDGNRNNRLTSTPPVNAGLVETIHAEQQMLFVHQLYQKFSDNFTDWDKVFEE